MTTKITFKDKKIRTETKYFMGIVILNKKSYKLYI
jgi:hypothetical protein